MSVLPAGSRNLFLTLGVVLWLGGEIPTEAEAFDPNVAVLKKAGISRTDTGLLTYLRQVCRNENDLLNLDQLIDNLGSRQFQIRTQAVERLVPLGFIALHKLQEAKKSPDREIATRAGQCIKRITRESHPSTRLAAVHLLLKRHPDGTAKVLLRYLPFVADDSTRELISFGLYRHTQQQGKVDSVWIDALKSKHVSRRALAALIVGRLGNPQQKKVIPDLLRDPEPVVRLRAAQGLLGAKEKAGIPTLIALLKDSPLEIAWQAEELLYYVAGDNAPEAMVGTGQVQRTEAAHKAWQQWWQREKDRVDLRSLDNGPRRPRLILLCGTVSKSGKKRGAVRLVGCMGPSRWDYESKALNILSARLVQGNRLLLSEVEREWVSGRGGSFRVTERTLQGKALWEIKRTWEPTDVFRLNDGGTLVEMERLWFRISTQDPEPRSPFFDPDPRTQPQWHPQETRPRGTGQVLCVLRRHYSEWVWMVEQDIVTGKELNWCKFKGKLKSQNCSLEIIDEERFLLSLQRTEELIQAKMTGEILTRINVPGLRGAVPMANGNFLVTTDKPVRRIFEMTPGGRKVWERVIESGLDNPQLCFRELSLGFDPPKNVDLDSLQAQLAFLKSSNPAVQCRAATVLKRFGPKAAPGTQALIQAVGQGDRRLDNAALATIEAIGKSATAPVIQALRTSKNPKQRLWCVEALSKFESEEQRLALIRATRDEDANVRAIAVFHLYSYALKKDREAVTAMVRALEDESEMVCSNAARLLGDAKVQREDVVRGLVKLLRSRHHEARERAAWALATLQPKKPEVVKALMERLTKEDLPYTRASAAVALGNLGPIAKPALPRLLKALDVKDVKNEQTAMRLIGSVVEAMQKISPTDARKVIPILVQILTDKNESPLTRAAAAGSLLFLNADLQKIVPVLRKTLEEAEKNELTVLADSLQRALKKLSK